MTDKNTNETAPMEFDALSAEPFHDEEQLRKAEEELSRLTADGYASLTELIDSLEGQATFPEAQVVFNVDLFSKKGTAVRATVRGADVYVTFGRLIELTKLAEKFGLTTVRELEQAPAAPAMPAGIMTTQYPNPSPLTSPIGGSAPAPAPTSAPATASTNGGNEIIPVLTIAHDLSLSKDHIIRVKSDNPKYKKFGLPVYEEVATQYAEGYATWEIGREFAPPEHMKFAEVDASGKSKKIVKFFATHP